MKQREINELALGLTRIAIGQSLAGKAAMLGNGMVPLNQEDKPARIINDAPVFYCGDNPIPFTVPDFDPSRIYKWGEFYHPYMLIGMPDTGGYNKTYVDTRVKDWYLFWTYTKLDDSDLGPAQWVPELLVWTPKRKGDTIIQAGYRMFMTIVLEMFWADEAGEIDDDFNKDTQWPRRWKSSLRCKQVFSAVKKTVYASEEEYEAHVSGAPDWLKKKITARKQIGDQINKNL